MLGCLNASVLEFGEQPKPISLDEEGKMVVMGMGVLGLTPEFAAVEAEIILAFLGVFLSCWCD